MKTLLEKISSYNIFNYLLPGAVFAFWMTNYGGVALIQEDIVSALFLYYFLGLVISRFGSLVIEPFLKATRWVKFAKYPAYLEASKEDEKLEVFSESNNIYRTFISFFVLTGLSKFYTFLQTKYDFAASSEMWIVIFLLLVLFLFSYRKQTQFIVARVEENMKNNQTLDRQEVESTISPKGSGDEKA